MEQWSARSEPIPSGEVPRTAIPRSSSLLRTLPSEVRFLVSSTPLALFLCVLALGGCTPSKTDDVLTSIRPPGQLVYGSDSEGGGPYIFPDPQNPRQVTGFEVELINRLAGEL